jgi:hypothetical protein
MPSDYPRVAILHENEIDACFTRQRKFSFFTYFSEIWQTHPRLFAMALALPSSPAGANDLAFQSFLAAGHRTLIQGRKPL